MKIIDIFISLLAVTSLSFFLVAFAQKTYAADQSKVANNVILSDIDIFEATRKDDITQIKNYIKQGGNLDVKNSKEYTPFILATYYGNLYSAKLLLRSGADACAVDEQGSNAFMGVAFKGHVDVAKWLLKSTKCDINHQNYAGQTALMMAALFDRQELVSLFIEHQANPEIVDLQGNTASSLAQSQGLMRVIDILKFSTQ